MQFVLLYFKGTRLNEGYTYNLQWLYFLLFEVDDFSLKILEKYELFKVCHLLCVCVRTRARPRARVYMRVVNMYISVNNEQVVAGFSYSRYRIYRFETRRW